MSFYYISKKLFFSILIYLLILKPLFFKLNTRLCVGVVSISSALKDYLKTNYLFMGLFFQALFFNLFLFNYLSLISFVFSLTTMSCLCLFLGYSLWMVFFLQNILNNWKTVISHLVPEGCPLYLVFFMVLIETVSLLIRPLTLGVRLMSNITAGHLLLLLMSKFITMSIFMIALELMVNIIQALVFSLLLTLYLNESS